MLGTLTVRSDTGSTVSVQLKLEIQKGLESPMMSVQFLASLGVLALLGLSFFCRRNISHPLLPFSFFWCLLLTAFISVLSVGLLQVHFDCPFLWGDCYARGYPYWLFTVKPLLLWSPTLWSIVALVVCLRNFWVRFNNK